MKKRALKSQISVFVIIAVILVTIIIVIISFNSGSIKIFSDEKSSYKVETYVESCLETQTKEAEKQIGLHGGFLYHKAMIFADRNQPDIINRKAKGIKFFDEELPYWYFYDDNDDIFRTNIPEYDTDSEFSIKNQIKRYLGEHLEEDCIKGFAVYDDIYSIDYDPRLIKDNIDVQFKKGDIISSLTLPITIREININNTEHVSNFESKVEDKLEVAYNLAKDIVIAETNTGFTEERILDFLGPYQTSKNREELPPFYDFRMSYDFNPWEVSKVKLLVQRIIESNIGLIQFLNTDYKEQQVPNGLEDSPFVQGFVKMYTKDYLSTYSTTKEDNPDIFEEYKNYKVKPTYYSSFYPSYFNLAPSLGNIILMPKPQSVLNGLLPFFFTEYSSVYEMTTPIVFDIAPSKNDNGFVFKVPIETNIDYNQPLQNTIKDVDVNLGEINSPKSLICDPLQFTSDYITLNITDPVDFGNRSIEGPTVGVKDAIVTFDCKGISQCFITQTTINDTYLNQKTSLKIRLPPNCYPGTLEVQKLGYKKLVFKDLNPTLDTQINLGEAYMPSKKTMKVQVKLVDPTGLGTVSHGFGREDKGFLIFTNLEDDSIVEVVEVNSENLNDLTVDLTLGHYKVEGFIITEEPFRIPSKEVCYKKDMWSDEECQTLPELNFTSWVRGGVEIDDFEVPMNRLLQRSTLVVKFADYGIPESYDELQSMAGIMSDVKRYSKTPEFD